ncbi:succinic semialdehyde dehydrogenase [Parvularcula bermudensis HTCC2503]|uniref:Succinic semialdehyde dehydrogenase n=1 Tax=Parvularcula bermudensis (strain ATCC BAA-594 / HTCC2503 / KCTC 12087) TaxID=314260 RepID=E0TFA8_PARBH|nr:NAD-dependent succinate-semialdehyde dehydrogenase [Parvularcula bermudensis]ADM09026.1 succinic semialdehyde dehydrogenase [Parvularcula bermudensis HTCC2503]
MAIQTLNPATEEVEKVFDALSDDAVDKALDRALHGQSQLADLGVEKRASLLAEAAKVLDANKLAYGRIMTTEMGKPLKQAIAEVEKCAWACRYYAEHGPRFMRDERFEVDGMTAYVRHLALGPILAVMPWNFPLWQVFRFAAPSMIGGNPGLLKHASNVPQSALVIEDVLREAGFPEGAFQTLLIGSGKVEAILRDRRVRGATVTGSNPAGSAVAKVCGEMIKPTVLELGGSDAYIVQPSADLDNAVTQLVLGRTQNNGQSCIAAKRFLIHDDIYDTFREKLAAKFAALTIGDPMEEATDIGPLAQKQGLSDIVKQVEESLKAGAARVVGAEAVEGPNGGKGYWFAPGLIEAIPQGSPAYEEEIFGPVGLMFRTTSLNHALALANANNFGLGSAIFTTDKGDIETAVEKLEAGATAVNRIVASNPHLPFGGVKESGYGRELSRDGLMAFVNRKTVTVSGL